MYSKLRSIRNDRKVSASEMKKILGLKTEAAYYKKESGMVKFSLIEAKIVSEKFNIPIEELFFEEEVSKNETNHTA
ncbi:helix-turn-helix transcriptional regulator [Senegalia massiliensis]|uniref:XRE family transcriptional regulator n=1 Tax=Senegalia massiliensis TaxID=1720316 RepID=A0A845R150_9CLOT|nr:XRE family transcriptional regulator [Senegalia massiliensis]NBI07218.1 XRE family transcriptional regulator [Senegalia massiliensis]